MPRIVPPWEIKREVQIKNEDHTDPKYGHKPIERPWEDYVRYGLISLDKQAGPTSHEVAAWVKKIMKLETIGHGGTLDPKVTGVLPITLEDATKVVQALLYSGKEYICVMKLHGEAQESNVRKILVEFEDEIYQRPPLRSSVKRQIRTRRIYYNEFLEMDGRNVLFRVGCEGGTYIRKLCYDIGEILGVGAHMQELRRTRSGPFSEESKTFVTLHDIAYFFGEWQEKKDPQILRRFIQPMETALELVPKITVRDSAVDALCHGANLTAPGVLSLESDITKNSSVAIFTLKGEVVALAKAELNTYEILNANHGTVAAPERVLMERGTYPRHGKLVAAKNMVNLGTPEHYIQKPRKVHQNCVRFCTRLCGRTFEFKTASSVFSVKRVDPGTRILIENMILPETGCVLDVGCGYGAIGIAIAKFNPRLHVVLTDVNRRASTPPAGRWYWW